MKNQHKKGQVNFNYAPLIALCVVLIFLGVIYSSSQIVLKNIKKSSENKISDVVANASFSWAGNNTLVSLAHNDIVPGSELVFRNNSVFNLGGSAAPNWTMDYEDGEIYPLNYSTADNDWWNQSAAYVWNITYTYYYGSYERNITGNAQSGLNTASSFTPTLSTVAVVIAVILFVVTFGFYVMKKMEE